MELKDSLIIKYNVCNDALASLYDAIILLERTDEISKSKEYLAFQDSVIKRFEYSLDVIWKYIKEYISDKFGITHKSPKETFREAFKQNLLNQQEAEFVLKMVDDRNETSHRYDRTRAKEISNVIPEYYKVLALLIKRAKP
jgi:nucleotidyltransferase substrate binding protein (TIGR01987 family)